MCIHIDLATLYRQAKFVGLNEYFLIINTIDGGTGTSSQYEKHNPMKVSRKEHIFFRGYLLKEQDW
jgi:hypothetical protein